MVNRLVSDLAALEAKFVSLADLVASHKLSDANALSSSILLTAQYAVDALVAAAHVLLVVPQNLHAICDRRNRQVAEPPVCNELTACLRCRARTELQCCDKVYTFAHHSAGFSALDFLRALQFQPYYLADFAWLGILAVGACVYVIVQRVRWLGQ